MTRYEFLHRIAEILTPKHSGELFHYIIHSMDHNGDFLRSRYCYWESALPDSKGAYQAKIVLVTMQTSFDFSNDVNYYEDDAYLTKFKMQIFLEDYSDEDSFYQASEWASELGFPYPVKIDMEKGIFEVLGAF